MTTNWMGVWIKRVIDGWEVFFPGSWEKEVPVTRKEEVRQKN